MIRLLIFLLIPAAAFGQGVPRRSPTLPQVASAQNIREASFVTLPTRDGKVFYEIIDSAVKKSKSELYTSAKLWFTGAFKDSKSVIEADSREDGEVAGKGGFPFDATYAGTALHSNCRFTIRITCKQNKYRIQIYDLFYKTANDDDFSSVESINGAREDVAQSVLKPIDSGISFLLNSARAALAKQDGAF